MIKFEDIPFYTAIAISVIFTIIREFFPTYKYLPNIDIPLLNTFSPWVFYTEVFDWYQQEGKRIQEVV